MVPLSAVHVLGLALAIHVSGACAKGLAVCLNCGIIYHVSWLHDFMLSERDALTYQQPVELCCWQLGTM